MIEDGPSLTALQVAAARAAHLLFDPAPHLLEDPFALDLLGPEHASMLEGYRDGASWILLENRLSIPLRARFVEDCFREAYARGVRQLVILGAGLDSMALRQSHADPDADPDPDGRGDLRVYEVDHPSMQAWKRSRCAALGWKLPDNVRMIACDFEKRSAAEALAESDLDPSRPAFLSWMGVTYYLEQATIEAVLGEFARVLARGSEIAFDVMRPWDELPERYEEVRAALNHYLKGAREPQITRYAEQELLAMLARSGFAKNRVHGHEELEETYRPGIGSRLPFSERFRLVHAST